MTMVYAELWTMLQLSLLFSSKILMESLLLEKKSTNTVDAEEESPSLDFSMLLMESDLKKEEFCSWQLIIKKSSTQHFWDQVDAMFMSNWIMQARSKWKDSSRNSIQIMKRRLSSFLKPFQFISFQWPNSKVTSSNIEINHSRLLRMQKISWMIMLTRLMICL